MPRFELNPRTGMMEPKKDDQIYFADSMGGGLRIDDHKNNVKYVVERDGRITNIFGIRGEQVNIYDMRDARIIADRVLRKLGRDNKYTDYHYFLKGYKVDENFVITCSEYMNESFIDDMIKRSKEGDVKKEVGFMIGEIEDGVKLICPDEARSCGSIVDFDGNQYYYFENTDSYFAVFNDSGVDTIFKYNRDTDPGEPNMFKSFQAPEDIRENDFEILQALTLSTNWDDDDFDDIDIEWRDMACVIDCGNESYMIFDNEDNATRYAEEYEREILDECYDFSDSKSMKSTIEAWRNSYGDGFIDVKSIEDSMRESYESWFDDMDEDDLINNLINYSIIDDTEEYFDVNEDGELDHELPKFEVDDYKDDYVDHMMDDIDDVVDEYLLNYGYEGFEEYIDKDKLAELIVDEIGRGQVISSADDEEGEETINGTTYYIYRTN